MNPSDADLFWKLRADMVLMRVFEEKAGPCSTAQTPA